MEQSDHRSNSPIARAATVPKPLLLFILLPALLGAAHHVDHIVRGNHVGWPLTPHVNAFTLSLAVYPLIAVGLYLTRTGRAGVRYWLGFLGVSSVLLASVHLGPWAIEPPSDVITPYADPVVGYAAFSVLLVLIASVAIGAAYAAVLSVRGGQ